MAKTKQEMLEQFQALIPYVQSLPYDEMIWNLPIAEGKWNLKEMVCHLMKWDQYFYEEAIHKITLNEPLTAKHLHFDEFNANASAYAKTQTVKDIVQQWIEWRNKLIDDISALDEEQFTKAYQDGEGKKFSVKSYLRSFISHDKHHKKQIEQLLKRIA
ncbi:DinB family protein [Marinicrinis lubricantis]|uniref:DinB family protein n=1 Tax=Marinicrinis lubricantis TaxID=2086470 RepID=A0ABW1IPB0_9BACL